MTTSERLSHAIRLNECSSVSLCWPFFCVKCGTYIFQVIPCLALRIVRLGPIALQIPQSTSWDAAGRKSRNAAPNFSKEFVTN